MSKIAIDKLTKKIEAFASGDKTDFSYIDSSKFDVKIIESDKLPDRIEACKWDGKKIIVDKTLKVKAENQDKIREIIETKKAEILEELAIKKAINEGLLKTDGSLTK